MQSKWITRLQWLLIFFFSILLVLQVRSYAQYESLNARYWQQILKIERQIQERSEINQQYKELVDRIESRIESEVSQ